MEKPNYEKYHAYKLAHDRMKAAFEAGFPLEVITIAESVITDRLLSHANFHGAGLNPDRKTLGPVLERFKNYPGKADPAGHQEVAEKVDAWRIERNRTLHGIAKSAQGEGPSIEAESFVEKAFEVAQSGMDLVAIVKRWHDAELRAAKAAE